MLRLDFHHCAAISAVQSNQGCDRVIFAQVGKFSSTNREQFPPAKNIERPVHCTPVDAKRYLFRGPAAPQKLATAAECCCEMNHDWEFIAGSYHLCLHLMIHPATKRPKATFINLGLRMNPHVSITWKRRVGPQIFHRHTRYFSLGRISVIRPYHQRHISHLDFYHEVADRRWISPSSQDVITGITPSEDAQAAIRAATLRLATTGIGPSKDENFKVTEIGYSTGRMSTINLPPTEILKRTSILPRDLVALHLTSREEQTNDSRRRRSSRPPTAILPRTDCILLSFGNIRAVAGRNSVYILDAHTPIAQSFAKDLSALYATETSGEHSELIFLETVLQDTVETYTRRIRIFEPIVDDFLSRATNEVFSEAGVHQLVPLKDSLQSFELQVKQSLECLTSILNDDDIMLDLLLAEQAEARRTGVEVDHMRHEYVELMLSVYSRQIQNLQQEIQHLLNQLQSKQEFITLAMAGYRNRLVRMEVNLSIIAVATGVTTATTGLFGMNLINGFEKSQQAFAFVTAGSTSLAVIIAGFSFSFIRGALMQERAEKRLAEIQTFVNSLSDMPALDYTVKKMLHDSGNLNKQAFKKRLVAARSNHHVMDEEIDFLFGVLDTHRDNQLTSQDFLREEIITKNESCRCSHR